MGQMIWTRDKRIRFKGNGNRANDKGRGNRTMGKGTGQETKYKRLDNI